MTGTNGRGYWKLSNRSADFERRRVFHLAYERRFYTQAVDAVLLHAARPAPTPRQPRFQAIFCIDEREESIRRHLEELAAGAATYGTAGFFSVAMYYRGAADAHFAPLCPATIRPAHWVVEEIVEEDVEVHRLPFKTRRALGMASFRFSIGSRPPTLGVCWQQRSACWPQFPLSPTRCFPASRPVSDEGSGGLSRLLR